MIIPIGIGTVLGTALLILGLKYRATQKKLRREIRARDHVLHASHIISEFSASGSALTETLRAVVASSGANTGLIMLFDREQTNRLTAEAIYTDNEDETLPTSALLGEGLAGTVAQSGQLVHLVRSGKTDEALSELPSSTQSAVCLPIRNRIFKDQDLRMSDVVGVLVLLSSESKSTFQGDKLETINSLGALLSMAVTSHWIGTHHRRTLTDTLVLISTTLEGRDKYMVGRSERLCRLALLLGSKFGMSDEALEELRLGMLLQDIGSVKVPDAILHKTGKLTREEFEMLQEHTTFGYELCRRLMMPRGVLTIVRNHHEKLDGTGYPDKLKGDQMPLALRIAALSIAFDAMASPRAFRTALSLDEILTQLNLGAGSQFDAVVVQTLRDTVEDPEFSRIYPAMKPRDYLEAAA